MMASQPGHTSQSSAGAESNAGSTWPASAKGLPPSVPLPSTAVLRGHKSVSIEHEGVIYRLQVTKLGKLILTK